MAANLSANVGVEEGFLIDSNGITRTNGWSHVTLCSKVTLLFSAKHGPQNTGAMSMSVADN